MALTREQFDELRSKGLSVEQIVKFEKGEQTQQPIKQSGGFIGNVGRKLQERGREFVSEISKASTGDLASTKLGTIGRGTLRTGSLIGGGLGDILIEGVKAILPEKAEQKIKEGISNVASKELPQKVIQSISSWAEKNPTAAKDLEGALEIAGIFPIVKGGKVAGKAAIQTGKEVAGDIGRVAGKTLATTGAITEKAGKSLVSATFPPTASQAKSILGYKATTPLLKRVQLAAKSAEKAPITPSEVALKYNLVGLSRSEIGAKAKRVANQLFENQVNPVINGIEKVVKPKEIFDRVKKTISKTADTSKKKSLINALDSLKDDYKNVSRLSYKKLDQIKSEMAKGLPAKVWKGQDIAGELNNVRKMFSDEARKLIRKELPDNVKRIYDEYGSLLSIMEKGEKSLQRGLDVGILGLTSEAIRRGATPLTTIGGKAINKAGEIIKGVGQKLQKGSTKLKSSGEKGSLLNIKPGLTIEDISKKGKGEILKSNPKKFKTAEDYVKAQGTPVYHGTTEKFNTFDINKAGQSTDSGMFGKGFYFSDDLKEATTYSKRGDKVGEVKEVILDIKNPFIIKSKSDIPKIDVPMDTIEQMKVSDKEYSRLFTEKLQKQGYDGVIDMMTPTKKQYVVFDPSQIKTKSQLTDIWNKANKKTPLKSSTDNLINEAKKYKSADEFVNKLKTGNELEINKIGIKTGEPLIIKSYHGTDAKFEIFKLQKDGVRYSGDGHYFTPSKEGAKNFGDNVIEVALDLKNPYVKYLPESGTDVQLFELAKSVRDKGYDAMIVRMRDVNSKTKKIEADWINEIVVFNENSIKTKSQLTDIWNKANGKTPLKKVNTLEQEAKKYKSVLDIPENKLKGVDVEYLGDNYKIIKQSGTSGDMIIVEGNGKQLRIPKAQAKIADITKEKILDTLNPTGSLYVDYTPKDRATIKLAPNITTLDKTMKKPADTMITIYRGAPKIQKSIVPGDFITTNYDLAKSYSGQNNVLSKRVRLRDILDDLEAPLEEEYLYRPAK